MFQNVNPQFRNVWSSFIEFDRSLIMFSTRLRHKPNYRLHRRHLTEYISMYNQRHSVGSLDDRNGHKSYLRLVF